MYDGRDIANFVLDFCADEDVSMTHIKLHKVLYYCHVWSLVVRGEPLIRHEFEAWQFGPVLPYIYREFKAQSNTNSKFRLTKLDRQTGVRIIAKAQLDSKLQRFIEEIVRFYGHYSATELIDLTHVNNGPWWKAWYHDSKTNPGMKIRDEELKEFYSTMH